MLGWLMLILLAAVLVAVAALAVALLRNAPSLTAPPGLGERLATYLRSNVAETRTNHRFPELELRCYPSGPDELAARLRRVITELGWSLEASEDGGREMGAVITTPLLGFKDDLSIRLVEAPCGTELHLRSASRVGRGDLAANARHIVDLHRALEATR